LTEKAGVANCLGDAETLRNFLEAVLERAFTRQNQLGVRIFLPEVGKSYQRSVQPLFLDEARGLDHAPSAAGRKRVREVWKSFHRHSRAIDTDFCGLTAQSPEPRCQRLAACENERQPLQQFAQPVVVAGLFVAQHDVHAMKGNQRWFRPVSHERQQMNARMAKINMQQIRMTTAQNAVE